MADITGMLQAAAGVSGEEADPNFNDTVLLLHGDGTNGAQNNTFLDSSTNNFTITRNGNVTQGSFSPFSRSSGNLVNAPYDPAVHGGSGYFDGTGDYLTVAYDSALTMPAGTDFCIEAWVYKTVDGAVKTIASSYPGATNNNWLLRINASNKLNLYVYPDATVSGAVSTTSVTANQWFHVAATRSGTTWRLFVNGNLESTVTATQDVGNANAIYIGSREDSSTQDWSGYISNYRMVVGSAVYTSSFTPSTSPLTAITNTELLTNFTNAGIFDNTGKNNLETVGNAQVDTTTKKFSTGSMEFDGTGDYLTMRGTPDLQFGTGDFTIECWVYFNSLNQYDCVIDFRSTGQTTGYPTIFVDTSSTIVYFVNSANRITSSAVSTGQFYHLAVCRSGTDTKMFIDGVQAGSTWTDTTNYVLPTIVYVGGLGYNSPGTYALDGFIDDLRITKGVARYTTTFTPPTKAFPDL